MDSASLKTCAFYHEPELRNTRSCSTRRVMPGQVDIDLDGLLARTLG